MKNITKYSFLILIGALMLSSCSKHCSNMLDGPLTMEERKFMLSSSQTFVFKNQFGDTDYVSVDSPIFFEAPLREPECDHTGNQIAEQLWRFPAGVNFNTRFEHYNGEDASRFLYLKLSGQEVFKYNIIDPQFITIEINAQFFHNTMLDSIASSILSPTIRKIWYGKHTGILKYEEWNGKVWCRQKTN